MSLVTPCRVRPAPRIWKAQVGQQRCHADDHGDDADGIGAVALGKEVRGVDETDLLPTAHMRLPMKYMHAALSTMLPLMPKKDTPVR